MDVAVPDARAGPAQVDKVSCPHTLYQPSGGPQRSPAGPAPRQGQHNSFTFWESATSGCILCQLPAAASAFLPHVNPGCGMRCHGPLELEGWAWIGSAISTQPLPFWVGSERHGSVCSTEAPRSHRRHPRVAAPAITTEPPPRACGAHRNRAITRALRCTPLQSRCNPAEYQSTIPSPPTHHPPPTPTTQHHQPTPQPGP